MVDLRLPQVFLMVRINETHHVTHQEVLDGISWLSQVERLSPEEVRGWEFD
jgi:hypothetical protein